MDASSLKTALSDPHAFPDAPVRVDLRETHISLLFFAGERVYKVKKAVNLGFLDFTALDKRRHFCDEEVRLNSRLSPEIYSGVVPIAKTPEGVLRVEGRGEIVEWAVKMRRLPEERMLYNLLARAEVDNDLMNRLAAKLAAFHAASSTGPGVNEYGEPGVIRENALENFEQTRSFAGTAERTGNAGITALSSILHAFLEARARAHIDREHAFLQERIRGGRIREGHGDLHAGNICVLPESLVIYDCIEFNRRFRCADVACDLAFLAMDLDFRGYAGFASYLVYHYAQSSGDGGVAQIIPFYKGYRAMVRAKVALLTAVDPALLAERKEELRRQAMGYFHLAAAYELPPALILMCGLPASGKTWAAAHLARPFEAVLLHSDLRRKLLSGVPPTAHNREGYDSGMYSPEMKQLTYESLLEKAVEALRSGRTVVVDATFSKRTWRDSFAAAARRLGHPCYVVHVTASEFAISERLRRRADDPREMSDADLSVYQAAKQSFEPPRAAPGQFVVELSSERTAPEDMTAALIDAMVKTQTGAA